MSEADVLPAPFRLIRRSSVGSTNDEMRRLASSEAAADFLVLTACEQSAGRGRRGRTWISPPGNLHCSVLLKVPGLAVAAQIGFVAAVALVDALAELAPAVDFRCKWPNDVLATGHKLAGMLLEPAGDGWVVLGLGVDVIAAPLGVEFPATCLAELGCGADADAVLFAFCRHLAPWMNRWRSAGFAPIRAAWTARAQGVGEPVAVRLEGETRHGIFAGLDEEGALLLDAAAGVVQRIMAGDVFFPGAG
ncbi:MAG: biotin--[acetyl-CoA-carboxylase] ligase [Magnetospirillum sp.]|nr:biotin--[acetyl-CoA-carboxylase] ligase [Magnetospirillum sp.]